MALLNATGTNLEDRLALISKMLEEAVTMLRNTMIEVRNEEETGRAHDDDSRARQAEPPS